MEYISGRYLLSQTMKHGMILLLMFCCLATYTHAQKSRGAVLVGDTSVTVSYYDALDIFGEDTFSGTATKKVDSFLSLYYKLAHKLGDYEKDCGMKPGDTLKIWWKVYFNRSGTIDGMVFNVLNKDLSDNVAERVYAGAREFMMKEKVLISSVTGFRQCGPLRIIIP